MNLTSIVPYVLTACRHILICKFLFCGSYFFLPPNPLEGENPIAPLHQLASGVKMLSDGQLWIGLEVAAVCPYSNRPFTGTEVQESSKCSAGSGMVTIPELSLSRK